MSRQSLFVAVAALSVSVFACAADDAQDDDPAGSSEDAIVGNQAAGLHRPKDNSPEFSAIYAAANAYDNYLLGIAEAKKKPEEKHYVRLETPNFKPGLSVVRSMQGWAYVEGLDHSYSAYSGESSFGDSSV